MNESDKRQLTLMITLIDKFNSGRLYISDLINNLESLLNLLEEKNDNWETEFRTNWLNIEIVYSISLDEERNNLDINDQKIIRESVMNLENLIKNRLNE